jgi:hypothetical protein
VAKDPIKNAKDAKNAKNAKDANPRELALLAVLGRAGDPIVAEAGGYTTDCGSLPLRHKVTKEGILGDFVSWW